MVLDDEEFCLSAMKAMLQILQIDVEHHVDFCIDGREAINKVKENYENGIKYKIIFTDFKMPIMDGIEATKCIRAMLTDQFKVS